MKLQHIELDKLKPSNTNVRKHGGKDVSDLIPSIRSLGVIQPLLVRPNCEGFEVVAGQRRLLACQSIAEETGKPEPVPCAILESGDDATAIEASLAENTARLPMDEMDQYEAFAALIAKGRSIADITHEFGVTELLVKKRLAIAGLITPIQNAYRREEIDPQTLRQLTLATKAQQKQWYKLFKDPKEHAPAGHRLKAWLFGGAEIPESSALFSLDLYKGNIVSDLFGDDKYFDDSEKFWNLQMEAIIHKQAAYLDAGWSDVVIMQIGDYFSKYDKVKLKKSQGGKVYISLASNGEIDFHEGWLDEKQAKRLAKTKANGKDEPERSTVKPELTKAAQLYIELHRHNAGRAVLLSSPDIALRLMVAHAICGSDLWQIKSEPQKTGGNEAIAQSLEDSKAQKAFIKERDSIKTLLELPKTRRDSTEQLPALFARLLKLGDKELMRVLAFTMADTLSSGTVLTDVLGTLLKVDMEQWWSPEDVFFDLLRDKPMINAMLAEIAGKKVANGNIASTAAVQRKIMRAALKGDAGRKKVTGWKPRYMNFPMGAYTKRGGLAAIENWKAAKKHFTRAK